MAMLLTPIIKKQKLPFIITIDFWGQEYVELKCFKTEKAVRLLKGLTKITKQYKDKKPKKSKNKVYYKLNN